jgi:hypothetical protein
MTEKQNATDIARADELTPQQLETVIGGLLPQIAPIAILISMGGGESSSGSGTAGGAVTSAGGTKNVRS